MASFALSIYLGAFIQLASSLQVAPSSECAALCLDNPESDSANPASSSTNATDIVCGDSDYADTSKGIKFKNCIDCLQSSSASEYDESDSAWFLYNLRYSVDVCLFGFPNTTKAISSPCSTNYACQPLQIALETELVNPSNGTEFDYCDADGGRFNGSAVDSCVQCLQASDDQEYMANFVTALRAGCEQRPQPGALIGLSGSLFTEHLVNITTPPTNETARSDNSSTTGMTTGAIVGIAVGAALLFLGGTALFWIYYRKQKIFYESDYISNYDPRGGCSSVTPPLDGAYTAFDSKPGSVMSQYELRAQAAYTNHSDEYDELEKDVATRQPNYHFDPNQIMRGPNSALPVHPAYVPRAMSRGGVRELSPEPSVPVKSNKPDDYALSAYMNASRASRPPSVQVPTLAPALPTSIPAYNPALMLPTMAARGDSYQNVYRNTWRESQQPALPCPPPPALSRGPSQNRGVGQTVLPGPPPPPPPRAPRLTLPTVSKLRGAKKYQPPLIVVEDATPTAGPGESVPIGLEISNPLPQHRQRFANESTARVDPQPSHQRMPLTQQFPGHIRKQSAVDRRETQLDDFITIHTGKSTMFG
ncbi:hypothetical protein BKA67DRAFT_660896 [Truncatella angustata]|uniref:Exo-alpha-sialidase / neuraminidase n=1 Tax=Truncatella angustata TaxID=152316 RepID=A0A9P8ZWI2_9PEZI|nr:uncharacterized protein BKA67DRAFT_660896 [Truncatella angustata]KAH6652127.1 hypothetical protein BKA67DRAFT_660896 [Truncatella angustata]KAH8205039.1 hypothetical protein TruAng_000762 [Truncatella angustata]